MKRIQLGVTLVCVWLAYPVVVHPVASLADDAGSLDASRVRNFQLDYGAKLIDLPTGADVRVWLPVPQNSVHQKIKTLERNLPAEPQINKEKQYGNRILFFETAAPASGELSFTTSYQVRRTEIRGLRGELPHGKVKLSDEQRKLFLAANNRVPVGGKPLELLNDVELPASPLDLGRVLYNRVDDHVKYDKSKPGFGNGDSVWVCDSRTGNCTDFHSLFISLARSQGVPATFEIGLPLPPERGEGKIGGYHCWALFYVDGHGWVPVDISEGDKNPELKDYYFGNLTENRVTFTNGRDIDLVPKQSAEPLNFFVYPHVEVNGKPWPQEKIELELSYTDK